MKILILGKGISNDGVELLLKTKNINYDYMDIDEIIEYQYDLVVKAPGIPYHDYRIKKLIENNAKIISDIELGMSLVKKFYILVTGTNGKTSTSKLIYHIMSKQRNAVLCGNIGYSFCRALVENSNIDTFIVEASSFQLENSHISPNISVILNINPAHLDHHLTFEDYVNSKKNIYINQSENDILIYNYDDVIIKDKLSISKAYKVGFSLNSIFPKCYLYDNYIFYQGKKIYKINREFMNKEHLIYDYMAAISTLINCHIKIRIIKKYLKDFNEIEYRLTKINTFIYNDAKSTNPYSTIAAIKSLDNIFLICGGFSRNENLVSLKPYLYKIKMVFAYGESKDLIYDFMDKNNIKTYIFDNLEEAFLHSLDKRKNEIILFSPMFASYDQFKNYIERGKLFNDLCEKYVNLR